MNDLTYPHVLSRLQKMFIIFVTVLGFLGILGIALTQQANAGFNCDGNNWSVADETELNSAITCYNAKTTAGEYNITFNQNISLTASTKGINNSIIDISVLVDGAGFTIDGQNIEDVRPFTIAPTTTVTLQDVTIMGGNVSYNGGGVYNLRGTVTITNSTIISNSAHASGGGVMNFFGVVTVNNSTIEQNWGESAGGGIDNYEGTIIIENSNLKTNSTDGFGAGITNNGTITIENSILDDNIAQDGGGAIENKGYYSFIAINHSQLTSNSAGIEEGALESNGGAIYNNSGTIVVTNSTINDNSAIDTGGGIFNYGTIAISNSTIYSNSTSANLGDYGGGIYNSDGALTINNSTFSNNSADDGGGIYNNGGNVTIQSSTFSNNKAGSGHNIYNTGTLNLSNSILATGIGYQSCISGFSANINDNGHNIVEDNSCGFTGGVDPMLGPLQDNGGSTLTHALLPDSPAIDTGDTTLTVDQRGQSRPSGQADDIGAYELFQFSDFVYLPMIQK